MRKTLFIFILGIACGVLYTQNDEFKDWADEGLDMGKEMVTGWFDGAKDAAEEKKESLVDGFVSDAKEMLSENTEEISEAYKEKQKQMLEDAEK